MPRPYVILHNGKSIMFANAAPGFWDGDWWKREFPEAKSALDVDSYYLDGVTMDGNEPGLWYAEDLVSIDGMSFTLFQEEKHSREDVTKAKNYLRRNRDVVGKIKVIKI